MPVDYSLGKVYKIVGNGKIYVGSTCERLLCQRFTNHRRSYKCWTNENTKYVCSSSECMSDPECYIELLELCPCSCIDELRKCEGKWIRELECVNKLVAGRTEKEQHQAYYEANKDKINEQKKVYNEANKERISKQKKEYSEANKERINEQRKSYRDANKELISQRNKEYREANAEAKKERDRIYHEANREARLEKMRIYKLKKKSEQ
jgi:hypothetical protein